MQVLVHRSQLAETQSEKCKKQLNDKKLFIFRAYLIKYKQERGKCSHISVKSQFQVLQNKFRISITFSSIAR
jgi:hypothetical protein